MVIRTLRWLHLYAGLVLALPLLLMFVSGIALVYKNDFWRWQHPELAAPLPTLTADDHAAAIESLRGRIDEPIGLVKYPQPKFPAYHLWLADGTEALVNPLTLEIIDRWSWWQRPTSFLAEIHVHLLAGDFGHEAIGWVGLALLFMLIGGLIVWWPVKHLFRWKSLLPPNTSRPRMLTFHRNLGVLTMPLALLLVLTGVGVAFFQPARVLLNGMFGDPIPGALTETPARTSPPGTEQPMATLLRRGEQVLPHADITFVYLARAESGVLQIRKKAPGEAHPNGLSFVQLDVGNGDALHVTDASAAPPGDRVANWLYPLHSGKWEPHRWYGRAWQFVVVLGGLSLVAGLLAGLVSWLRKPSVRHGRRTAPAQSYLEVP